MKTICFSLVTILIPLPSSGVAARFSAASYLGPTGLNKWTSCRFALS
jgi:hypothetical protein